MARFRQIGHGLVLVLLSACAAYMNPGANAMMRIDIGMSRGQALVQLSDAWHIDACPTTTNNGEPFDRRDLFWYGPTDVAEANVIVVVYAFSQVEAGWIVDRFEMAENYLLDDFYGDCSSLDLSPLNTTIEP